MPRLSAAGCVASSTTGTNDRIASGAKGVTIVFNWVTFTLVFAGWVLIGWPLYLLWMAIANPAPPPIAWREAEWKPGESAKIALTWADRVSMARARARFARRIPATLQPAPAPPGPTELKHAALSRAEPSAVLRPPPPLPEIARNGAG